MRTGDRTRFAALTTTTAAAVGLALALPIGAASAAGTGRAAPVRTAAAPAPKAAAAITAMHQRAVLHTRNGRPVRVGPNPALALQARPGDADYVGWARSARAMAAARAAARARQRAAAGTAAAARLAVVEKETRRGTNDSRATAQRITAFGTGAGRTAAADVTGTQTPGPKPAVEQLPPNVEDDGSPENARVTGVSDLRGGFGTTGTIGDAPPNPDGTPAAFDDDLYALDLTAGQLVDVRMTALSGDLQPLAFLIGADGSFLGDTFDAPNPLDVTLTAAAPRTGRYFLDASSLFIDDGTGNGKASTGRYRVTITARAGDADYYAVTLAAGDVLGANVAGAGHIVTLVNDEGATLMGSTQDATSIMPANTPLPGGGNAVADTVAPRAGTYYVAVSGGSGPYTAQIEAYRPGGTGKVQQTIFLDLDGQRLNTGIFGGRGVTTLSPLSTFLPRWGLKPAQRAALVQAIKATVTENVKRDLRASGLSSTVSVSVVTSDEVPDPWGKPGVSRVVVGGTIAESGVDTIGIAQTIDPGNFSREETALVLLDLLSEPGPNPEPFSLNAYLKPRSDRVGFVGQAVGNVVSHEIGHYIGNWHTDNTDEQAELMDAGGEGFDRLFGVGPDGVGGTADDVDVDFGVDTFNLFEGFIGTENTRARSTWALSR